MKSKKASSMATMVSHSFQSHLQLKYLRTSLWHLRNGGVSQMRQYQQRVKAERYGSIYRGYVNGTISDWPLPDPNRSNVTKTKQDLTVAVIADDFTRTALSYEWKQIELTAKWADQLHREKIDLLFIESSWNGNRGTWKNSMTGKQGPTIQLKALVNHCKDTGIPTVFWNKEDPAHFEDFIKVAALFDYVYTTDMNMVAAYKQRLGHHRVSVLSFGAQPAIHNPVRPDKWDVDYLHDVAFGGTYFRNKFPERRQQLELLLDAAILATQKTRGELNIYSRNETVDKKYCFPDKYRKHVQGTLTYEQMLTAYRIHKVFLNVNSVVNSPSMCARRIFEITACGSTVVSAGGSAVSKFFPNTEIHSINMPSAEHPKQAEHATPKEDDQDKTGTTATATATATAETALLIRGLLNSPEYRDRRLHLAQRRIWKHHTYTHRVNQMLDDLNLQDHKSKPATISALISTNRPQHVEHVLAQMNEQKDVTLQILLLTHGFEIPAADRNFLTNKFNKTEIVWISEPESTSLGTCYNRLIESAEGQLVAKIDDDDLYGPHYLFDQVAALNYSGTPIVGKGSYYTYLTGQNHTVLRFPSSELKYRPFVAGATIVASKDLLSTYQFSDTTGGEDSRLLKTLTADNIKIFSTDRFGFLNIRNTGSQSNTHTWNISDTEILASSRVVAYGRIDEHILI